MFRSVTVEIHTDVRYKPIPAMPLVALATLRGLKLFQSQRIRRVESFDPLLLWVTTSCACDHLHVKGLRQALLYFPRKFYVIECETGAASPIKLMTGVDLD